MDKVKPKFEIYYQGQNIYGWIHPYLINVTFSDYLQGQSDELAITLEDSKNLWKNDWYPNKGDEFLLSIGYEGLPLINCGSFELDEIEFSGPPDTVSLKALAADISKPVRQENTVAYENLTLEQIADEIAQKHGYEVVGIPKDIKVERITQNQEKDLAFLARLAAQYGYVFKNNSDQLVFSDFQKIEEEKSIITIHRNEVSSYNISDITNNIYSGVEVSYYHPDTQELITATAQGESAKGDILKIRERCENIEQAQAKADAKLRELSKKQKEGSISLPGNNILRAGANIELKRFGKLDGKYNIETARHSIDRSSGYTTDIGVKNV